MTAAIIPHPTMRIGDIYTLMRRHNLMAVYRGGKHTCLIPMAKEIFNEIPPGIYQNNEPEPAA